MIFFPRVPFFASSEDTTLVLCDPGEGGNVPIPHHNHPQIIQNILFPLFRGLFRKNIIFSSLVGLPW